MPIALVAIPGTLLVLIALSMKFIYGLIAAGFCYGAMYLLMHSKQATLYRTPRNFGCPEWRRCRWYDDREGRHPSRDRTQPRSQVRRRHHLVANPNQNSGQQNTVSGMNRRISKLGPISCRVDVEARVVPTTLAGGLMEPVASAIMSDMSRVLQLP